jgi:hypothetical protein
MVYHVTYSGASGRRTRALSSLACLAFVALLGTAFWAGAVWIGQALLRLTAAGF